MKFSTKKISGNILINLLLMVIVFLVLIFVTLFWLKNYTHHNQSITVPDLKGLQVAEAAAILKSSKLNYEVVDSIYEKRGTPGAVLEQVPRENTNVKESRTIYLIVQAISAQMVTMPDLTDYSQRQAETLLNALGFNNVQIEEVPSDYKGLVISLEYRGVPVSMGQKIPKGSLLRLKVGDGANSSFGFDSLSISNEIDPLFQE